MEHSAKHFDAINIATALRMLGKKALSANKHEPGFIENLCKNKQVITLLELVGTRPICKAMLEVSDNSTLWMPLLL